MNADLGFLLSDCSPSEHAARLRELRALLLVYLGLRHPVTAALCDAIGDPTEAGVGWCDHHRDTTLVSRLAIA
jgi:hypothetical protein